MKATGSFKELTYFTNVVSTGNQTFGSVNMTWIGTTNIQTIGLTTFYNARISKALVFDNLTTLTVRAFGGYPTIPVIVVRTDSVPTADSGAFAQNSTTKHIYVKDALVDSFKAATGWSSVASYIFPLSQYNTDYPDDPLPY